MTRHDASALLEVLLLTVLGGVAVISGFGMMAALLAIAGALIFFTGFAAVLGMLWGFVAACIAVFNATACVAGLNEGAFRALGKVSALSALVIGSCPFLWLRS